MVDFNLQCSRLSFSGLMSCMWCSHIFVLAGTFLFIVCLLAFVERCTMSMLCYQFWYRFGISTDIMTLAILSSYRTHHRIDNLWLNNGLRLIYDKNFFFSWNLSEQSICNKIWQIYFKIRNTFPLAHKQMAKNKQQFSDIHKQIHICDLHIDFDDNKQWISVRIYLVRWTVNALDDENSRGKKKKKRFQQINGKTMIIIGIIIRYFRYKTSPNEMTSFLLSMTSIATCGMFTIILLIERWKKKSSFALNFWLSSSNGLQP